MMTRRTFLQRTLRAAGASVVGPAWLQGCRPAEGDGRIRISYWEKWGGNEGPAMKVVVDQFNASQDRIWVDYLSVSQIDRKVIISIAGGDPPDIVGIWSSNLAAFADRDAILPLGGYIEKEGMSRAQWLERYMLPIAGLFEYKGEIYGLPSTPSASALHWNKSMFRQAGLDPERPPRTLEELDGMARQLARKNPATGQWKSLGFLPQEPGFWSWAFLQWFGGSLFDEAGEVNIGKDPRNLAAMEWVKSYTETYGLDETRRFTSGFGGANTPQAAFFNDKIAMVFQGVWMDRHINLYAPGLDYGAAEWPHVPGTKPGPFTVFETDAVVICRGSRHPDAAWEFIRFLSATNPGATSERELRGVEKVCFHQEKHSPMINWSPYFTSHHPHHYIRVFRELAMSPSGVHAPVTGIWQEYNREIGSAIARVSLLESSPKEALRYVHRRVQYSWDEHRKSVERQQRSGAYHPRNS